MFFVFKKHRHVSLSGNKSKLPFTLFLSPLFSLTDTMLPQAISTSDRIWAVATQMGLELSEVCGRSPTGTIKLIPPLSKSEPPMGCSASGMSPLSPPIF